MASFRTHAARHGRRRDEERAGAPGGGSPLSPRCHIDPERAEPTLDGGGNGRARLRRRGRGHPHRRRVGGRRGRASLAFLGTPTVVLIRLAGFGGHGGGMIHTTSARVNWSVHST